MNKKKQDTLRVSCFFGCRIGIRTPTNRVRVCRATVTQFGIVSRTDDSISRITGIVNPFFEKNQKNLSPLQKRIFVVKFSHTNGRIGAGISLGSLSFGEDASYVFTQFCRWFSHRTGHSSAVFRGGVGPVADFLSLEVDYAAGQISRGDRCRFPK